MTIPKPTPEEMREDLYQTLLELCGDVLLLDCLLFPEETENRPGLWEPQEVRAEVCGRLAEYVQQHARDTAVIAKGLKNRKYGYPF